MCFDWGGGVGMDSGDDMGMYSGSGVGVDSGGGVGVDSGGGVGVQRCSGVGVDRGGGVGGVSGGGELKLRALSRLRCGWGLWGGCLAVDITVKGGSPLAVGVLIFSGLEVKDESKGVFGADDS